MDNPNTLIVTNAKASPVAAGKRPKKKPKLDRKSSRGMIYENEELRLRTININAEVERGQSDIKRLKKENELLRREIWTLRDECDRLHKKVKAKFMAHDQAVCNLRCKKHAEPMTAEYQCPCLMADGNANGNGIDSDYCHSAQQAVGNGNGNGMERTDSYSVDCHCGMENDEDDHYAGAGQIVKSSYLPSVRPERSGSSAEQALGKISTAGNGNEINGPAATNVNLSDAFDNLSVVMEENANDEDNDTASKASKLPSLLGRITPLTSIELVANELKDLQSLTPPLSYFESIINQRMASNNDYFDSVERIVTGSAETVTASSINWDPGNQQNKTIIKSSLTSSIPINGMQPVNSTSNSPLPTTAHRQQQQSVQNDEGTTSNRLLHLEKSASNEILVTANTTSSALNKVENYRKYFFAPLKPKKKFNAPLVNQCLPRLTIDATTTVSTPTSPSSVEESSFTQTHGPPDLWVLNGLATETNQAITTTRNPDQKFPDNNSPIAEELESDKLHSLLNEIESISEDIHSLQLQKNKSHEELSRTREILECKGENLKPFKSEMNLLLTYDKSQKPKIELNKQLGEFIAKPFTSKHSITTSSDLRRIHSLDRNDTDSPSPNMPAAMLPFPENRNYMDFQHLNKILFEEISSDGVTNMTQGILSSTLFHPPGEVTTTPKCANRIEISEQRNTQQANFKNDAEDKALSDADDRLKSSSPAGNQSTTADNPTKSLKNSPIVDPTANANSISNLKILSDNKQLTPNKTQTNGNQMPANENVVAAAFTMPIKCLRRHSESTVQHINHCTNAINASSPHYHHSHHHHHQHHQHQYQHQHQHQHHHDHSNRQDNRHDGIDAIPSETNSSCPSSDKSRDSLSSSSPRLQRRKLSINSQHGGKIPWFGCWGNGCL